MPDSDSENHSFHLLSYRTVKTYPPTSLENRTNGDYGVESETHTSQWRNGSRTRARCASLGRRSLFDSGLGHTSTTKELIILLFFLMHFYFAFPTMSRRPEESTPNIFRPFMLSHKFRLCKTASSSGQKFTSKLNLRTAREVPVA